MNRKPETSTPPGRVEPSISFRRRLKEKKLLVATEGKVGLHCIAQDGEQLWMVIILIRKYLLS